MLEKYRQKIFTQIEPILKQLFRFDLNALIPVWILLVAGLGAGYAQAEHELFWRVALDVPVLLLFIGVSITGLVTEHFYRLFASGQEDGGTDAKAGMRVTFNAENNWIPYAGFAGILLVVLGSSLVLIPVLIAVMLRILQARLTRWTGILPQVTGFILTGLCAAAVYQAGWLASSSPAVAGMHQTMAIALLFFGLAAVAGLCPREKDRSELEKIGTTGFLWVLAYLVLVCLAAVLAVQAGDAAVSTSVALILPFVLVAIVYQRIIDILRIVRYSIFILAFFTGARYPLLYLPLLTLFYLSRAYYNHQSGVKYPTLEGPYWAGTGG
ncbi:MAG: hypothetical protein KAU50_10730 [Candidatus Marinimicrobia bacterium]|nr:hypothetical protein [Candidatus Neomarinimicrobiota bacterium]